MANATGQDSKSTAMINVLSFDGGGSRGIMEVMILDDFMRLVTLMKNNPDANLDDKLEDEDKTEFKAMLAEIEDPIHPTEIFDCITGKNKQITMYISPG